MTRTLPRSLAALGLAAALAAGLAVPAAAASGTTVYVVPADISNVNISFGPAGTKWDAAAGKTTAPVPASPGNKWVLDIEDKPQGTTSITADGLVLAVSTTPAPQKVRYQYYVGSGGYPTIDSLHPTLDTLLASPVSWDLKLLSGDRTIYGPVFQVQLQKLLPGNAGYARVTVQTVWNPADGSRDLQAGLWYANTNIYAAGYPANATTYAPTGDAILNRAGSGPGVSAAVLADNFGDFEVVSFGPNLGRDYAYSFAFQNLTLLGHTFSFVSQLPVVPVTPVTPPSSTGATTTTTTTTTPGTTPRRTTTGDTQLETFALPEETAAPTPTPSPSQSDEPAATSDDDEGDGDVVADPPATEPAGFPTWLLLLGIGFLVLVLAIVLWILRRRTV